MASRGILYDGATAYPYEVTVEAVDGALRLATADGHYLATDASLLTRTDEGGGQVRLGRSDRPGWRLLIDRPVDEDVLALVPDHARYGRWIDRFGLGKAAIAFGVVAAAVVAVGYTAPHWVAPHVPLAWERNLGDSIVGDFGDLKCRRPDGQRALNALVERVAPGGVGTGEGQVRPSALDVGVFNAAALPGGHIVAFKPAITETDSADALSGIIAHEVAHVRRRHVTEALVRELGIGALIRLFAGNIGANAEQLMALSYTRANEAEADRDAIAMLRRAGIDPRPTARLFNDLAGREGDDEFAIEWLASHPASGGRGKRFAASYDPRATYRPALGEAQYDALWNICWKGPAKARPAAR